MHITEIKNTLKQALRDPKHKAFYFSGGRCCGKSTLIAQTFKEVIEELVIEKARENAKTY